MNERGYSVYRLSTPDGKSYIGQTQQEPEKRWGSGTFYKNNADLTDAIQKFGWTNVRHEILESGLTREEAYESEKKYIDLFDSMNPEKGYNKLHGEQHRPVYCFETGETFSSIHDAARSTGLKRHMIKAACIGEIAATGKRHWCFADEKESAIIDWNRKTAPDNKPVVNLDTGEIYSSCGEAGKAVGVHPMGIRGVCLHQKHRKYAAGFRWAFLENYESDKLVQSEKRTKVIRNISTGETFKSAREAWRKTGIGRDRILSACRAGTEINGEKWEFAER